MDKARMNGIELEYDVSGSGEPVLLIGNGPIRDSFLPLQSESALAGYRLIRYRQRGQSGGPRGGIPVSFAEHASDAAALARHLGVSGVHAVGHSTGAAIALQLAMDHPGMVRTLAILEPPVMSTPAAARFLEQAAPALAASAAGDLEQAMTGFLTLVSGLDAETCRRVIDGHVPGGMQRAIDDADVFFGSYLPALGAWEFGPAQAAAIDRPVLSVLGAETHRWFVEGQELLRTWLPRMEEWRIEGAGHLLHLQQPAAVAKGLAGFFTRRRGNPS